jgi:hypothetical protein
VWYADAARLIYQVIMLNKIESPSSLPILFAIIRRPIPCDFCIGVQLNAQKMWHLSMTDGRSSCGQGSDASQQVKGVSMEAMSLSRWSILSLIIFLTCSHKYLFKWVWLHLCIICQSQLLFLLCLMLCCVWTSSSIIFRFVNLSNYSTPDNILLLLSHLLELFLIF